jgi:hypothetical protein
MLADYVYFNLFLDRRWENKNKLMVADTPLIYSALNFFMNAILICYAVPKYFKDLLAIIKLRFCPAIW